MDVMIPADYVEEECHSIVVRGLRTDDRGLTDGGGVRKGGGWQKVFGTPDLEDVEDSASANSDD